MNIAEMYIIALRARLVAYLVVIQIVIGCVVARGVEYFEDKTNIEGEKGRELIQVILEQMFMDMRTRYLFEELVIFTVARYNYVSMPAHLSGSYDMHLQNAKTWFTDSCESGKFMSDYKTAFDNVVKPIEQFITDNKAVIEGIGELTDESLGTISNVFDAFVSVVENTHVGE